MGELQLAKSKSPAAGGSKSKSPVKARQSAVLPKARQSGIVDHSSQAIWAQALAAEAPSKPAGAPKVVKRRKI